MELSLKQKKPVIFILGIVGSLADKKFWEDLHPTAKFFEKAEKIVKDTASLIDLLGIGGEELDKIYKDLKRGIYTMNVFHNAEIQEKMKQVRKMPVKIQKDYLDDLIEIAACNCKNCKRNIKQCYQRKLFKKMGIDAYDPEKTESKCEFWHK